MITHDRLVCIGEMVATEFFNGLWWYEYLYYWVV